jgi:Phage integrase, N-terminal SAM-like domain
VTQLLQRLRDELVRRDYAAPTIRGYTQIVEAFRRHTGARLDRITPAQLRRYHLFLLEDRRLAIGTVERLHERSCAGASSTALGDSS